MSIPKQALSEAELLKEIYKKLAGDSPLLDLSKAQSRAQLLRAIASLNLSGESPDSAGVISITYDQLSSLIAGSGLVPGQKYLITDYQTVHVIPDTADVNTGAVEPLLVTALSSNELEPIAFSPLYPDDIIYYSPVNGGDYVPGCTKGYIYRRIDTAQNNDLPFDFRQVRFRRWQIDVTTTDATGAVGNYSKWSVVRKTNTNEIYIKHNDLPAVPFSDTASWRRFEWDNLSYVSWMSTDWFMCDESITIPVNSNNFNDFLFFSGAYASCYNNTIQNSSNINNCSTVIFGNDFYGNTIGNYFYNNSIGSNFNYNSIGSNFSYNSIGNNFYVNSIGSNFTVNSIGNDFYNNSIGSNFNYNSIGSNFSYNSIGNNFYNNSIGSNFYVNYIGSNFTVNSIGSNFYGNTIGNYFYVNTIGNYFYGNTIGNYFYSNTMGTNFRNNFGSCESIEFSSATHVYANTKCQFMRQPNGAYRLMYVNDNGVLTVVDIDS
ncbi:MAG TPA: hypothetical protein PKE03_10295 [Bacteroidales bacterium]|nr:hypothetical protein [Bacteroidales bacterium]